MFQDGTLIDLCGATLLWRTADGLAKSPTSMELDLALDRLNAGKPQCPVNLNTLIIPKKKSAKSPSSRQPYVNLSLILFYSSLLPGVYKMWPCSRQAPLGLSELRKRADSLQMSNLPRGKRTGNPGN